MNGINLKRLKTSLTKHGATKLAPLLRKHSAGEVLDFVSGKESGINIDLAQAKGLGVRSCFAKPRRNWVTHDSQPSYQLTREVRTRGCV